MRQKGHIILDVQEDGVGGQVAGMAEFFNQIGLVEVVHHFLEDRAGFCPAPEVARVIS